MILQSLCSYYERQKNDPDSKISKIVGHFPQAVHFSLVLDKEGHIRAVDDLREHEEGKQRPQIKILPSIERTSKVQPQFMWDNTQYIFGIKETGKLQDKNFNAFREHHHQLLKGTEEPALLAVLRFLDYWNPSMVNTIPLWDEITKEKGAWILFRLDGEKKFCHESPEVNERWKNYLESQEKGESGPCLVTGEYTELAKLHPGIKRSGSPRAIALLVSFNKAAFLSRGKEQSYNAPTGKQSAFEYTTALNYLLWSSGDNRQRIKIGDTTTVFWAARQSPLEAIFGALIDPSTADDADNKTLREVLDACRQGKPVNEPDFDGDVPFYILGISPNNARLAVRFWCPSTVGEIAKHIAQHFSDMKIVPGKYDKPYPGIKDILRETVRRDDKGRANDDDISSILAGQFARSVFTGQPYPDALRNSILSRIRIDKTVNATRAGMLKAILIRIARKKNPGGEEPDFMSLDKERRDPGYLAGRLFAVLEWLQIRAINARKPSKGSQEPKAIKGPKTTISDRYFASASTMPMATFVRLMKLSKQHMSTLRRHQGDEAVGYFDRLIREIEDLKQDDPQTLNMEQQSLFAIGYYHQKHDMISKRSSNKTDQENTSDE